MRQYDDPVEVRRGEEQDPDQFLWRGRLWKVRTVLAHWVETGPWWQAPGVRAVIGSDDPVAPVAPDAGLRSPGGLATDLLVERELWRVEAGRGHAGSHLTDHEAGGDGHGVFDLSFDWEAGSWQLVGCLD
jgi:hypothetical protein